MIEMTVYVVHLQFLKELGFLQATLSEITQNRHSQGSDFNKIKLFRILFFITHTLDTERKLNLHKTLRRRFMHVLFTFFCPASIHIIRNKNK